MHLLIDKSLGQDQLRPRVLYKTRGTTAHPLFFFYFLDDYFLLGKQQLLALLPVKWKLTYVTANHKKDAKKIIEATIQDSVPSVCIVNQVNPQLRYILSTDLGNNLLSNRQYGFIKGRPMYLQLILINQWIPGQYLLRILGTNRCSVYRF